MQVNAKEISNEDAYELVRKIDDEWNWPHEKTKEQVEEDVSTLIQIAYGFHDLIPQKRYEGALPF